MAAKAASRPAPKRAEPSGSAVGWYYILHGDDDLGLAEALSGLRARMAGGDASMADLNTNILDGRHLSMAELRHTCDTVPFLADRRLVIVRGLLSRLAPERKARDQESAPEEKAGWKREYVRDLKAYLPGLPPTTRLVFLESVRLDDAHPVLKFAIEQGRSKGAFVELREAPPEGALRGWIQSRAQDRGGAIRPEAAGLLAHLIGRDLRQLDLEIDKLLTFADGRPVTEEDVQALVSRAREMSIWDLVDSVGRGRTGHALDLLHGLLDDGEEPLYLFAMLCRQVRILILVSDLQAQGLPEAQIAGRAEIHPYAVKKALGQARAFDTARLETAHRRLVETDWAIKTGRIDPVAALDLLVISLAQS